jgi:hypothetical protein
MKLFGGADTAALKQHFGKKIMELEDEKRAVQVGNNSTNFHSLFFKSKRGIFLFIYHFLFTSAREGSPAG